MFHLILTNTILSNYANIERTFISHIISLCIDNILIQPKTEIKYLG